MKNFYLCLLAVVAITFNVSARENKKQAKDKSKQNIEQIDMDKAVWKKRATYLTYPSLFFQTLNDKTSNVKYKGFKGISISWGRTFYLHKKPINNIMKFGLDWTWFDFKGAFILPEMRKDNVFERDYADIQYDFGMQIGPSITFNPKNHLKLSAYLRFTPSFSLINLNEIQYGGFYASYNAGCSIAWKVMSFGVEGRTGSGNLIRDDDYEGESIVKNKFSTNTLCLYFGFRF